MAYIQYHYFPCLFILLLLQLAHISTSNNIIAPKNTTQPPIIIPPYIIDYRNGTIARYSPIYPSVPPPNDPQVQSKDISIPFSRNHYLRARAFVPARIDPARKIPILIYFHGGAFCIGSPFSWSDTHFVARVVVEARVLALAIDYRLYPEFTVPAPYDDAWAALEWVAAHVLGPKPGNEPWVAQYGDLQRVYVGGDSAGGNIAHNLAMHAGMGSGPRFKGLFLNMPYFLGKRLVPLEPEWITNTSNYKVWAYVCPNCKGGVDNGYINPFGPLAPRLALLGCKKILVYTAEMDELRGRAIWYYERVKRSKWAGHIQWIEAKGKRHVFHIAEPQGLATTKLVQDLSAFLNDK